MQITWFAGSTTVSVANGGSCYPECCAEAPYASTHTGRLRCLDPVFSPTVFFLCLHVIASWLLRGACCKHLWVCRRSPLQRNCFPDTALCCDGPAVLSKQGALETMQANAGFRLRCLIASQQQNLPKAASIKINHCCRAGPFFNKCSVEA